MSSSRPALARYRLSQIPRGMPPRALCEALLVTTGLLRTTQLEQLAAVRQGLGQLLTQHRHRLLALYPQPTPTLQFELNCPPPLTERQERHMRECRRRSFCPFCWGRFFTSNLATRLEQVLYGGPPRRHLNTSTRRLERRQPCSLDLLEIVQRRHFRLDLSPELVLQHEHGQRLSVRQALGPAYRGGFTLTVLAPEETAQPRWQLEHRTLALVHPGLRSDWQQLLPAEVVRAQRWQYPLSDPVLLSSVVARTTAYPLALLSGPLDPVRRLLCVRRQYRLSSYQGLLRGALPRQRQAGTSVLVKQMQQAGLVEPEPLETLDYLTTAEEDAELIAKFLPEN